MFRRSVSCLLALGLWLVPQISLAQPESEDSRDRTFQSPPPPDVGEPRGRSRGGGYRGPECERYADMTPLVPTVQGGDRAFPWGLTTQTHPTLWLSAPEGLAEGVPIEFALWSEAPRPVYRTLLTSNATPPGSFQVQVPDDAPALSSDVVYYWTVSIFCDPETPDVPLEMGAYIQRTDAAIPSASDALQRSAAFGQAGIWYDALTVLGEGYLEQREGAIASAWSNLLNQVGLNPQPNDPVGSCCQNP